MENLGNRRGRINQLLHAGHELSGSARGWREGEVCSCHFIIRSIEDDKRLLHEGDVALWPGDDQVLLIRSGQEFSPWTSAVE